MTKHAPSVSVPDLLFATPLYVPTIFSNEIAAKDCIKNLMAWDETCDSYCPDCGSKATFRGTRAAAYDQAIRSMRLEAAMSGPDSLRNSARTPAAWELPDAQKILVCTRNPSHVLVFYFRRTEAQLQKVGQFPSLADLTISETKRFRAVLGADRLRELNKAIGLAAHGVGIGSFVYLRRNFESLVEEAHQQAKNDPKWNEEFYRNSRMHDRIGILAGYLPQILVQNYRLYGVLSAHIHELSDDEALANFDLVKQGIFAIAEERLAERERQARASEFTKALARFSADSSGSKEEA